MATISKRGAGYRIKVSLGYDMNGKQIIKSTTFSPPLGVSESVIPQLTRKTALPKRKKHLLRPHSSIVTPKRRNKKRQKGETRNAQTAKQETPKRRNKKRRNGRT